MHCFNHVCIIIKENTSKQINAELNFSKFIIRVYNINKIYINKISIINLLTYYYLCTIIDKCEEKMINYDNI